MLFRSVETAAVTCELVLTGLRECLPPDHAKKAMLTSKVLNRHGDALLLLGRADEALDAYNAAVALTPDDSYPIYNRARAHLVLGNTAEAKADFTAAASSKFNQPKARKLAEEALAKLK